MIDTSSSYTALKLFMSSLGSKKTQNNSRAARFWLNLTAVTIFKH